MANHFSILAEKLLKSMKRQKYMTLQDAPARPEGVQYATGKSGKQLLIAPERMTRLGQRENDAQLRMRLLLKIKSDAGKNIAYEPGMLGP